MTRILVTGGAKGVGAAIVRALVAAGHDVDFTYRSGNAAYAASKGALISYAKTLAVETGKRGVTVNVIAPGFVDTDMMAPYAAYRDKMQAQIPAGRFARPEEVAGVAAFLMSEPAAYISGTVLPVDGGLTAQLGVHR